MSRLTWLLILIALVRCTQNDSDFAWDLYGDVGEKPPTDLGTNFDAARPALPGRTFLLRLDAGAFPKSPFHPSALVYLPTNFDPTPPVSLLVYIHGFNNCVENIVRPSNAGQPCTNSGPVRQAFGLIAQLEAAHKNAILLCPEVAFDQSSANPGKLDERDGFRALLEEVLQQLREPLYELTLAEISPVALASHSGGYAAAAAIATRGGVPIRELYLLDSLYGATADFDSFVRADLPALFTQPPSRRFANVYTDGGGTLQSSQAMADRLTASISERDAMMDDRTTATWPLATYQHGLLFKRSALSHDGIVRYYFQTLIATSGLAERP